VPIPPWLGVASGVSFDMRQLGISPLPLSRLVRAQYPVEANDWPNQGMRPAKRVHRSPTAESEMAIMDDARSREPSEAPRVSGSV